MLTFAIVCFLMFVSPGPGALSLAGVGAAFGFPIASLVYVKDFIKTLDF